MKRYVEFKKEETTSIMMFLECNCPETKIAKPYVPAEYCTKESLVHPQTKGERRISKTSGVLHLSIHPPLIETY